GAVLFRLRMPGKAPATDRALRGTGGPRTFRPWSRADCAVGRARRGARCGGPVPIDRVTTSRKGRGTDSPFDRTKPIGASGSLVDRTGHPGRRAGPRPAIG